ncbi:MAG: hypothetical protein CMI54_07620 [Parcubacteria group bacterium]|nr:hypothetical protein [Parcubacteria group bacterium]
MTKTSKRKTKKKEISQPAEESNGNLDLIPKEPPKLAPQGIRTFTVCRQQDTTGVSGDGVIIEGVLLGTGQCIVHWLFPPPRGGVAIFDSMEDFLKVHVLPHPENETIITYQDARQEVFGGRRGGPMGE